VSDPGPARALYSTELPANGYAWWYLDVWNPETNQGLVIILLLGSVFSPGYARARKRGPAEPLDFCAVNVALYGRPKRWAMTEHPRAAVERSADGLRIGRTAWAWEGSTLVVKFDERTAPWPGRVVGEVRLEPAFMFDSGHFLDSAGLHRWWPVAPVARAEVRLSRPEVAFSGLAYHDQNTGTEALEGSFRDWDWSRAGDGQRTEVLYDVREIEGGERRLGRRFFADGRIEAMDPQEEMALPSGLWGIKRATRRDPGEEVVMRHSLEDTPFYTRAALERGGLHGTHESLDLRRFDRAWVRFLLPFRMRGGFRW
jgi:carotenoid 1,2-hydratase